MSGKLYRRTATSGLNDLWVLANLYQNVKMKSIILPAAPHFPLLGLLAFTIPLATAAERVITTADLPESDTAATWTSEDAKLTINAWADAGMTTPANIGKSGIYFKKIQ